LSHVLSPGKKTNQTNKKIKQKKNPTLFLFSYFNTSLTYQLGNTEFTPSQFPSGSSTVFLQAVSPLLLLGLFGFFFHIVNHFYYF